MPTYSSKPQTAESIENIAAELIRIADGLIVRASLMRESGIDEVVVKGISQLHLGMDSISKFSGHAAQATRDEMRNRGWFDADGPDAKPAKETTKTPRKESRKMPNKPH